MSSSRDHNRQIEDTYESQNDQRLDDLHSKIRTLRGITTDINEDVERQNLMLDDTNNSFSSFANSLSQSTRRAGQAFGLTEGGLRISRVVLIVLGLFFAFWIGNKILGFWRAHA
ncbi:hypothetical protein HGRIS_014310 [Hohenbuehelia grisea]|uniref:t-SNARE coiled-coil homology domain-containing protein n=1 Tax=Hohenbuehelia grisea TaxID=104357 RepID=A0ABR3JT72_9AGAR